MVSLGAFKVNDIVVCALSKAGDLPKAGDPTLRGVKSTPGITAGAAKELAPKKAATRKRYLICCMVLCAGNVGYDFVEKRNCYRPAGN